MEAPSTSKSEVALGVVGSSLSTAEATGTGLGFFSPGNGEEIGEASTTAPIRDATFSAMQEGPDSVGSSRKKMASGKPKGNRGGGSGSWGPKDRMAGDGLEGPLDALAWTAAVWIRRFGRGVESVKNAVCGGGGQRTAKTKERHAPERWHQNIKMMLLFRLFNGVAFAARAGGVFDSYIFSLFGDNMTVGLIGTLNGAASVMTAPVVGFLSDHYRHRRSLLLKFAAVAAIICLVMHSYAVSARSLPLLMASTFCWRSWYEFVFVVTEALFADSVPQGSRSSLFTKRRVVTTLSNSAGPLVTAAMLYFLKKEDGSFPLPVIESLLHFALLLVIPQVVVLWFWRDVEETQIPQSMQLADVESSRKKEADLAASGVEIAPLLGDNSATASATGDNKSQHAAAISNVPSSQAAEKEMQLPQRHFLCFGPSSVPWLLFASHVVTFAGAGMTVKFFPLFFKTEYGIRPIQGCLLSSVYTLFITGSTLVIQRIAQRVGRPQASLCFGVFGIIALLILSKTYSFPLVIAMYILRGSLHNASAPIDRSMQMDYVSPGNRGKWTAMESLLTMAWAFSALFGGFIADQHDYRFTFKITAIVFVVGAVMYSPLLWLVPRDESFAVASAKKKRH